MKVELIKTATYFEREVIDLADYQLPLDENPVTLEEVIAMKRSEWAELHFPAEGCAVRGHPL